MKLILYSIILILTAHDCTAQKNKSLSINYVAITRGSSIKITLDSLKLTYRNFEGEKTYTISNKNWNEIENMVKKIDLNSINALEAPTTKSHTDAALIASINIISGDKMYDSSSFDHGNPPKELKVLINKLFELANLKPN